MKFKLKLRRCLGKPQTKSTRELDGPQSTMANNTLPQIPQPPEHTEARVLQSMKRNKGKVTSHYKLGQVLGTGGFAVVRHAIHKATGEEVACKIMKLPRADETDPEAIPREDIFKEIEIVSRANNAYVVCMKEFFVGKKKVYIMMDLMRGGMLLDGLLNSEDQHYTEKDARQIFHQLLQGLSYLHARNVIHRDLKLENVLMVRKGDISHIKIVDFGLAKHTIGTAKTVCGTPQFVAPEVIKHSSKEHGKPVDMWSAGVVLFMLLGGYPPFYDQVEQVMFQKIEVAEFSFDDPVWDQVADSAKDLICKCFILDPGARITVEEALQHPWFSERLENAPLSEAKQNLVKNKEKMQKFRKVVLAIQAMNRMGMGGFNQSDFAPSDEEGSVEDSYNIKAIPKVESGPSQ
ncbi:hypothetical protein BSKO_12212 [Bryopsis sp. KO-2023]|nr:hypothetical protein BSKO_12212 [Bryopsis sp. KO-2023]